MFCKNCGGEIDDKAVVCPLCGVQVGEVKGETKVNGLGIAGFVIGLISLWLGVYLCIASIVGLCLSAAGIAYGKKKNCPNGLAVAGLVLSIISLVIWGIVWLAIGSAIIGM